MSRDRIWPPLAWNVHAFGSSGGSKFTNVGFPFLWHRIQSWGGEVTQVSDTMYGEGVQRQGMSECRRPQPPFHYCFPVHCFGAAQSLRPT
eukprot:5598699-Amphidinium_carterae.1